MTGVVYAAQGWFDSMRLAWGAWLSSPGAGILGALGAGWFAYRGIQRRIDGERSLAMDARTAEAEVRAATGRHDRWQWYYEFLWTNRDELPPAALRAGVQSLLGAVETESQTWQLDALTRWVEQHAKRRSGGTR